MKEARWQVGLDIGQGTLEVCVVRPESGERVWQRTFPNNRAGYQQLRAALLDLLEQQGANGLDVGGEATGNYWLPLFWAFRQDSLWDAEALRLYLLNPRQMYWFRRSQAEAEKTDAKDSYYLAEKLRTQSPAQPWEGNPALLRLRFYSRYRFFLSQQSSALKNLFWAYMFLWCSDYRPHHPFSDGLSACGRALLREYSDWQVVAALPVEVLGAQLATWSHGQLRDPQEKARQLQAVIRRSFAPPAEVAPALHQVLRLIVEHLENLEKQMGQLKRLMREEIARHHPGAQCLMTIPGIDVVLAAGITAEIGDLQRFFTQPKWDERKQRYRRRNLRDVEDAVAKEAGLWWPRRESGNFRAEDRRLSKQGNRYLRYYLVQAADCLRRHLPEYRAYYQRKYQEAKTHRHKRALVLTARKSVGLFVGLLHRQEPYRSPEVRSA